MEPGPMEELKTVRAVRVSALAARFARRNLRTGFSIPAGSSRSASNGILVRLRDPMKSEISTDAWLVLLPVAGSA